MRGARVFWKWGREVVVENSSSLTKKNQNWLIHILMREYSQQTRPGVQSVAPLPEK